MRVTLLLLSGCISASFADTADSADSAAVSDSPFCIDWCPDVDGDGLGAPDLACAAVCLPPGSVPSSSACTYVANCDDPEPMVAGHSKPGVPPPVLALVAWKFALAQTLTATRGISATTATTPIRPCGFGTATTTTRTAWETSTAPCRGSAAPSPFTRLTPITTPAQREGYRSSWARFAVPRRVRSSVVTS